MSRQKSEYLSAFGIVFEILKALVDAVKALGGGDEDIRRILTSKKLREEIAKLIVGARKSAENTFRLVVDYSMTLAEMVSAGKYDWVNSEITENHFPNTRRGKAEVTFELVHFNKAMSSEDALNELDKLGLRPATIWELLAFGTQNPEEQRKYPIVALGSVWQDALGSRHVPFLWIDGAERDLGLHWWYDDWGSVDRFAALRK